MATVHRASIEVADGLRRDVALKRLLPQLADDRGFIEDFIREAKLVAGLDHPNIVKLLELGCIDRTYYIVMELVQGVSLLELMRAAFVAKQPTPIGITLSILCELCDALDYASNGTDAFGEPLWIVHRDLSPSNLIITDGGQLKVIDFGVAKAVAGSRFLSNSGLVKGKLAYMAPEALGSDHLDSRADLFSAGVVGWEMLAARRLFKADNDLAIIDKVREMELPPPSKFNPAVSPALDTVILHALARSLDERWASAAAMRTALERVRREYREPSTPAAVVDWARELLTTRAPTRGDSEPAMRLTTDDLVDVIDGGPDTNRSFRLVSPGWASVVRGTTEFGDESKLIEIGVLREVEQIHTEWIEDASKMIRIEPVETTEDRAQALADDFDARTTASGAPAFRDPDKSR